MAEVIVSTTQISEALLNATSKSRYLRKAVENIIEDGAEIWRLVWDTSVTGLEGPRRNPLASDGTPHPYQTGEYREHIKTEKLNLWNWAFIKKALEKDAIAGSIYNDSPVAEFVEYGTKADNPGGHSPWGPNTPTPAFHCASRAADLMREGITGK